MRRRRGGAPQRGNPHAQPRLSASSGREKSPQDEEGMDYLVEGQTGPPGVRVDGAWQEEKLTHLEGWGVEVAFFGS